MKKYLVVALSLFLVSFTFAQGHEIGNGRDKKFKDLIGNIVDDLQENPEKNRDEIPNHLLKALSKRSAIKVSFVENPEYDNKNLPVQSALHNYDSESKLLALYAPAWEILVTNNTAMRVQAYHVVLTYAGIEDSDYQRSISFIKNSVKSKIATQLASSLMNTGVIVMNLYTLKNAGSNQLELSKTIQRMSLATTTLLKDVRDIMVESSGEFSSESISHMTAVMEDIDSQANELDKKVADSSLSIKEMQAYCEKIMVSLEEPMKFISLNNDDERIQ